MIAFLIIVPCFLPVHSDETLSADAPSDSFVNCPDDWYYYSGKCYWISGKEWDEGRSFSESKLMCSERGAQLASIHSRKQQDFLTNYVLLDAGKKTWIGLKESKNASGYEWDDMSDYDFNDWYTNEPVRQGETDQCVVMWFLTEMGRWVSRSCEDNMPYLCEKDADSSLISHNKMYCSTALGGGYKFHQSCYHIVNEPMAWMNAESFCESRYSGHLITIPDFAVAKYIGYIVREKNISRNMWIGLKATLDADKLTWESGWPISFTAWREKSAYKKLVGNTCAIVTGGSVWDVKSCEEKHTFICEYSARQAPEPPPSIPGSYCPQKFGVWKDLGGKLCYYISSKKEKSWIEANAFCQEIGGNLASIHSNEILQRLEPFVRYLEWINVGLIRQQDGQYAWVDGTDFDFKFWAEHSTNAISRPFSSIDTRNMELYKVDGDVNASFLCSTRKILPKDITSDYHILCPGELYIIENQ